MASILERMERPPALHRVVQETIKNYIRDNNQRAGSALPPETELSRQLGVSRNAVREAVKALESMGILDVRRGSGLFVRAFSFDPLLDSLSYNLMEDVGTLAELLDVRLMLETGMIAHAIAALTPEQHARLCTLRDTMREQAGRGEPFADIDRAFHQALFEQLGNHTLLQLLDIFWLAFRTASEINDIRDPDPIATYHGRDAIVDAVVAGDVARAQQTLAHHYDSLERRLARARTAQTRTEAA